MKLFHSGLKNKFNHIKLFLIVAALLSLGVTSFQPGHSPQSQNMTYMKNSPNVVIILADDLGYSDIGCYGGEINTPNLDKLASCGIRFTSFYNAARCCPSRASLLTGLYPYQAGVGHMTDMDYGFPGYRGDLNTNTPTIAEVLKSAGYLTYMTGKWHVTKNARPASPNKNRPVQRGFDHFYGTLPGYASYWDPYGLMEDSLFIRANGDYYYTEAITAHACQYIRDAASAGKPFFLYVAYTAPHYPLQARQKFIDKYEGVFDKGWDQLRQKRYNRLKSMGMINPKWPLSARDTMSMPWGKVENKKWQAERMQVFAAMVEEMDQGIGEILRTLDKTHQRNNTLIFFLSDNGGSAEGHLYGKIERLGIPWKSWLIPDTTRDGRKVRAGDFPGIPLGADTTFGSYGLKWANLSNAPFRLFKSWVHEGGISTPFIVSWSDRIKDVNTISHQIGHIIDLMPTILDACHVKFPDTFKGKNTIPPEGISLLPALEGKQLPRRTLHWEHEGNKAIREGKWKLVMEYPGEWNRKAKYMGIWELYDMEKDRTEIHNLADKYPKKVNEMSKKWEKWAKRCNVQPWEEIVKKQK